MLAIAFRANAIQVDECGSAADPIHQAELELNGKPTWCISDRLPSYSETANRDAVGVAYLQIVQEAHLQANRLLPLKNSKGKFLEFNPLSESEQNYC